LLVLPDEFNGWNVLAMLLLLKAAHPFHRESAAEAANPVTPD
jgi:hypothetical protein